MCGKMTSAESVRVEGEILLAVGSVFRSVSEDHSFLAYAPHPPNLSAPRRFSALLGFGDRAHPIARRPAHHHKSLVQELYDYSRLIASD